MANDYAPWEEPAASAPAGADEYVPWENPAPKPKPAAVPTTAASTPTPDTPTDDEYVPWENPAPKPKLNSAAKAPTKPLPLANKLILGLLEKGAGAVDAGKTMVTGALAARVAPLAGAGATALAGLKGESLGTAMSAGEATRQQVQGALTHRPRTPVGKSILNNVDNSVSRMNDVWGQAAGAVNKAVGSPMSEAAATTIGEQIPNAVSVALGLPGAQVKTTRIPLSQAREAIKEAQDNGFLADPATSNPGIANTVLSSLGGAAGIKVRQAAHNVEHATTLAKEDIGIPADQKLDRTALKAVRDKASQIYDKIRGVKIDIPANDPQFQQALQDVDKGFESVKEFVPGIYDARKGDSVRGNVGNPQSPNHPAAWTPKSLLDVSQYLRAEAARVLETAQSNSKAFKEASEMKAVATSMEDLLERGLQAHANPPGVPRVQANFQAANYVNKYRKARELIAKTYDIQEASNLVTGKIDPMKLAQDYANDKDLTGNLEKIARAASTDGVPMDLPAARRGNAEAFTKLTDLGVGAAAAAAVAGGITAPYTLGMIALRPGARAVMSSKAYQNLNGKVFEKPVRRMKDAPQAAAGAAGADALRAPTPMSAASAPQDEVSNN